jgi:hypothetical protein
MIPGKYLLDTLSMNKRVIIMCKVKLKGTGFARIRPTLKYGTRSST